MASSLVREIVAAIRSVLPPLDQDVGLHAPDLDGYELELVTECVRSGWVSSVGGYVDRFEKELGDATGAPYVLAVSSGTSALHLALLLAGVGPDDEVLTQAFTFVATANAISYCGASPHFCDIEETHFGIDVAKLTDHLEDVARREGGSVVNRRTGRRIAAVLPMHTFGHPSDILPLLDVAESWGLPVVEDAAEGLGSYVGDRHVGTFGLMGTLSFNGNKIVTTGGGGAILFRDEAVAVQARHLATTGKRPHRWEYWHDQVAYNYRMPNLNAALGCAQLSRLPEFIARKRRLALSYASAFAGLEGVEFVIEPEGGRSNYWLNTLLLPNVRAQQELLAEAVDGGLGLRPPWVPLHRLPMYEDCEVMDLSCSERLADTLVNIPSSAWLSE
jgi:perosamine synthetase